jgi:hypothetical protein
MDTDAAAAAAAAPAPAASPAAPAAEAKKKVTVKKSDIKVESFSTGGLDQALLNQLFEREVAMATQVRTHNDKQTHPHACITPSPSSLLL